MQKLKGIDGKLDDICRALCKERADWKCEKCGKEFPERRGGGLEWSHHHGRRSRHTRWDMDNCSAHCSGCHFYLGGNPLIFADWIKEKLGEERASELTRRFHAPKKWTKGEKEEMQEHYRSELNRLLKLRRVEGVTGYIEVVNYF